MSSDVVSAKMVHDNPWVAVRRPKVRKKRSGSWRWRFITSDGTVLAKNVGKYATYGELMVSLGEVFGIAPAELRQWSVTGFAPRLMPRRYGVPVLLVLDVLDEED